MSDIVQALSNLDMELERMNDLKVLELKMKLLEFHPTHYADISGPDCNLTSILEKLKKLDI